MRRTFLHSDHNTAPCCRSWRGISWLPLVVALQAACLAAPPDEPAAPVTSDPEIEALLAPIRERHGVPGLVAGIVRAGGLEAAGAVGLRKHGCDAPITVNDKLHLGSCTKAMTATWLAMFVEKSQLAWDSTIEGTFPTLKDRLHADFHPVTLHQLLTHRAGLPANTLWGLFGKGAAIEQRENVLVLVLGNAPPNPPATKFEYSNVGYVVAGHMGETLTGKSWEESISDELFKPLGMDSAGFGPPGTIGEVDQPWGHVLEKDEPSPNQIDNPPVLGPAGRVHCSLADWGKFVALHIKGARGEQTLLSPKAFEMLHTPPEGGGYSGGWGVVERPWAHGRALTHSGSNTSWYATVWIAPARAFAVLSVANQGGDAGRLACDEAVAALVRREGK